MVSHRATRLLIASLFTVLAVLPAVAAPPDKTITRTTSLFLTAFAEDAYVDVFTLPEGGYIVCVGTPEGFGCAPVGEDAVHVDEKNLTSARLGPVTIQLEECDEFGNCEPGDEVTVALTFTGTGELTTFQYRSKSSNGCKILSSGKGIQREGEATIRIDGETYDADAFLATSRDTFKMMCRR